MNNAHIIIANFLKQSPRVFAVQLEYAIRKPLMHKYFNTEVKVMLLMHDNDSVS